MSLRVLVDRSGCLSSGCCVQAAPEAFGFDDDHLAQALPGASALGREVLIEIAKGCPGCCIMLQDEAGNEIDVDD